MPRQSNSINQVIKIVEKLSRPVSSNEIKDQCPDLDRATIYRALKSLKEKQLIRIVEIGDGIVRFESIADHHHHLVCLKCKKIEKIELPQEEEKKLQKLQKIFQKQFKFTSLQHSLEFFGLCAKCR
jgi:Fur family ferric uptake transcriptional regulator